MDNQSQSQSQQTNYLRDEIIKTVNQGITVSFDRYKSSVDGVVITDGLVLTVQKNNHVFDKAISFIEINYAIHDVVALHLMLSREALQEYLDGEQEAPPSQL